MEVPGVVTAASVQGPRSHQEDRWLTLPFDAPEGWFGHLLAVLDGHGGNGAVERCHRILPELFSPRGPQEIEEALRRTVAGLDRATRGMGSGTTASLVCVLESHGVAAAAVLGDSPVVATDREGRVVVSPIHNVRVDLQARAEGEARGGVYEGGYLVNPDTGAGIQVSRALGDRAMGTILGREPSVYTVELGPGSRVLLATDGLIDRTRSDADRLIGEALDVRGGDGRLDASALIRWAETRGLGDNATAVVWDGSAPPRG